jgi:hypothetical protein
MAKLGDAFSDDQRRESVKRQLQPGTVIYLEVTFPEGKRSKYLVVAHLDRDCCTFVVNSRVHPFIESHAALAICQVKVDSARHSFLIRDSHVACHQIH